MIRFSSFFLFFFFFFFPFLFTSISVHGIHDDLEIKSRSAKLSVRMNGWVESNIKFDHVKFEIS